MGLRGKGMSPLDPSASYINALIYGASGNGKTTTASTVPGVVAYFVSEPQAKQAIEEQYRLDIESGDREENSLEIFLVEELIDARGRVTRTKMQHLDQLLSELEREPEDFTAVVLDSLTDMQSSMVGDIEDQKNGRVQMQDWGKIIRDTEKLAERLRDLKMHTFVITLAQEKTNDENQQFYRPALKGRVLPDDLPKFFNIVAYIDKVSAGSNQEPKHIARMRSSTTKYMTKAPRCFDPFEEPNVRVWVQKLNEARESVGTDKLPTKSQVTPTKKTLTPAEERLYDRLENAKTKKLFAQIEEYQQVPEAKKIATLQKYKADEKLWEVLERQISKLTEKDAPAEEEPKEKPAEEAPAKEAPAEPKKESKGKKGAAA